MNSNETSHSRIFLAYLITLLIVMLVPLIPLAPRYDTFIHPFRPEFAASALVLILVGWLAVTRRLDSVLGNVLEGEFRFVNVPFALFITWSTVSILWADSWRSVVHHTGVWTCFLALFLLGKHFFEDAKGRETALWLFTGIVIFICAAPIAEFYTLSIAGIPPKIGLRYARYNELLVTFAPLIFVFGLAGSKLQRAASAIALMMTAVLIFATARRAGMAILVVELISCLGIIYAVRGFKTYRVPALKICGVVIAGLLFFQVISFAFTSAIPASERYNDLFIAGSDGLRRIVGAVGVEMGLANPITGVGANNYGHLYGRYPQAESLLEAYPLAATVLEDQIAERAHNEYIQIFAELGFVGLGLFSLLLLGILFVFWRGFQTTGELPLVSLASLVGASAFLVSSLVSSYSFRLVQNGVAFFVVIAIGIAPLVRTRSKNLMNGGTVSLLMAIFIAFGSIGLLAVSINRIYAVHVAIKSEAVADERSRIRVVDEAMIVDPDNASLASYSGSLYKSKGEYETAARRYQTAIERGRITVLDYFNLSSAYYLDGRIKDSLAAIETGLLVHPRSVFLLVRRGLLLEDLGLLQESNASLEKARWVNKGQAEVWENYQRNGGRIASIRSHETGSVAVMDLYPEKAVHAIKAEREIRFPNEKFELPKQD